MASFLAGVLHWILALFGKDAYRFSKRFQRDIDALDRKNPDLEEDLKTFLQNFESEKVNATRIPGCKGAMKLRMQRSGQGKSGGYRVVFYAKIAGQTWFLTMYPKSEKKDLDPKDAKSVRKMISRIKNGEEI